MLISLSSGAKLEAGDFNKVIIILPLQYLF